MAKQLIKVGTLVNGKDPLPWFPVLKKHGFESYGLNYWMNSDGVDFVELSKKVKDAIGDSGITCSSVEIFSNALTNPDGVKEWEKAIDHAHLFGTNIVSGFAGRDPEKNVPDNIPLFKKVYEPLVKRAADKGVNIAFENCSMGGNWHSGGMNIANSPLAWDLMFDAIPADNIGLEFEPCHQLAYLRDPIAILRKYAKKVLHLHGKDANIDHATIAQYGVDGARGWHHDRTPGYGDTDWREICRILYEVGFEGAIDIEGAHDYIFNGNQEMTGQVASLNYLKLCRGGEYVPPIA
ncbi:sugar phosphate isomerase [Clostridia bacterium]|nr:sugar phosphate isomerase [Clostridia bacterium]GHV10819.1 sugar phosphate isomerase [Clostridia bacterium]